MKVGLPSIKNVLTPSAKSILIPLELTASASVRDAAIQKKTHGSRSYGSGTTALIISSEEMEVIMNIVNSLEECSLLIKGASETIENDTKRKRFQRAASCLNQNMISKTRCGRKKPIFCYILT